MIEIFLALIAGILTIAAPCILLPLPILLGSSVGQSSKTRPLFITLGFVVTFAILGITLNFLVQHAGLNPNALRTTAVIALGFFAVFMIWPTPFERLTQHMSGLINSAAKTGQSAGNGNFGGFVMGVVIGVVWAPCAGPILGSILTLIAQESNTLKALSLLVAYAIGAGIPMLAIAYGGQAITTKVKFIAKYATRLQQVFGVILLLLAFAIYFQYDTVFQAYLVEKLPVIGSGLETKIVDKFNDEPQQPADVRSPQNLPKVNDSTPQSQTSNLQPLTSQGIAPEFTGINTWLNTDQALTLKELRGKVVLVDFWTYSCINCVRTLPYVTKWYDTYKDKGFVVIGVHTPEFAFEKVVSNIQTAIGRHKIHYPVAVDSDYGTWNAYNNQYWPAEYLIDQNGNIVRTHFGEGEYDETEMAIKQLLGLAGGATVDGGANLDGIKSPEMYFGINRLANFGNEGATPSTKEQNYTLPLNLSANTFALEGTWKFDAEKTTLTKGAGKIKLRFNAGKVHMVAAANHPITVIATVDGKEVSRVTVQDSSLYTLFNSADYRNHILEITIPDAGFEAFTFTFG